MKVTHWAQVALACVAGGCAAALPLIVQPMTPVAWVGLVGGVALAVKSVLSVQSEVKGDKE